MDSWMLWLDGALEVERAMGAAPVLAATYISLKSVPVTPESVDAMKGKGDAGTGESGGSIGKIYRARVLPGSEASGVVRKISGAAMSARVRRNEACGAYGAGSSA